MSGAQWAGWFERDIDLFVAYLPLWTYEQKSGVGLAGGTHLLAQRGVIASEAVRKPGPKLSAADVADIARLVQRQERRLAELGA